MKRWTAWICMLCLLISLPGCVEAGGAVALGLIPIIGEWIDPTPDQETIMRLVRENQELLTACAAQNDYTALEELEEIERVNAREKGIEFYCGGGGIVPSSWYCGFYYIETDDISEIWCAPSAAKLPTDGGGYLWEEPDGDDRFYAEWICGHFYYYEASF